MNRFLILLFSIFFIGCRNEQKTLNNEILKKIVKTTEYTIKIEESTIMLENDLIKNQIQDTLSITENTYNENDQIVRKKQRNIFAEETTDIKFVYNKYKKIKREIIKLSNSNSSLIVNYYYKDNLLLKKHSENIKDVYQFIQTGEYEYNTGNTLKQSSHLQQYIDIEKKDTISNMITINKYDGNEFVTQSQLFDFLKPERNQNSYYDYDRETLIKRRDYNSKDSLLLKTVYKYEFDEFNNWTKKEWIENDKLNYIQTRKIEYK